jgi:hypothetical protein
MCDPGRVSETTVPGSSATDLRIGEAATRDEVASPVDARADRLRAPDLDYCSRELERLESGFLGLNYEYGPVEVSARRERRRLSLSRDDECEGRTHQEQPLEHDSSRSRRGLHLLIGQVDREAMQRIEHPNLVIAQAAKVEGPALRATLRESLARLEGIV